MKIEKKMKRCIIQYAKENEISVKEAKAIIMEDYGKYALRGYAIFESDDFSGEHIEKIDEMGIYEDDLEAGKQAEKDGISLIPAEELPKDYPYNCYRFIDTPENREVIKKDYEENNKTNTEYHIF